LDNLRDCKPSRIITVFGCCGDWNREKRAYMGEVAHYKSDIVILTNDNPRSESPKDIIRDIVAGWPDALLLRHSWFIYPWYQDISRLPLWVSDQILWAQSEVGRYIIEDRYIALRCAIYIAHKEDIVLITGKGSDDYQEWAGYHIFESTGKAEKENLLRSKKLFKSWFDDRVECKNALSKLQLIDTMFPELDRSILPWTWRGLHRRHPLDDWNY